MNTISDNTELFFIGGSGRSGTTILKKILSQHPDVASIHEFKITIDPDGLVDFYKSISNTWNPYFFDIKLRRLEHLLQSASKTSFPEKVNRFAQKKTGLSKLRIKLERKNTGISISEFCPDYDALTDELIHSLKEFSYPGYAMSNLFGTQSIHFSSPPDQLELNKSFGNFYRKLAESIAKEQQAKAFIDDNTWNILHFDTLLEWLPGARLVHIYRHPFDVVSSFLQQTWTPDDPVKAAIFLNSILTQWINIRDKLPPESYLEISLEDLVADSKHYLTNICNFYALDWNEQLLSVDLSNSHSGRWKKDLPDKIIPQLTEILDPIMKEYGYSTDV